MGHLRDRLATHQALTERLTGSISNAQLQEDDPTFSTWVAQVTAFIETPARGLIYH